ncbi:hypothetical protein JHK85_037266 [Glycine max]|nr:hypothetical protein JHK85_037266 [Glycine max]
MTSKRTVQFAVQIPDSGYLWFFVPQITIEVSVVSCSIGANLLVDSGVVKLTDFGMAKHVALFNVEKALHAFTYASSTRTTLASSQVTAKLKQKTSKTPNLNHVPYIIDVLNHTFTTASSSPSHIHFPSTFPKRTLSSPRTVAKTALLDMLSKCGSLDEATKGVLREMGRENVELSEFTSCSALKSGASLKALELGRQGWKNDMMYNSMVFRCVRNRSYDEAVRVMGLVRPNVVALTSALVGCYENLDLWAGKQIHCVVVRWGFTF